MFGNPVLFIRGRQRRVQNEERPRGEEASILFSSQQKIRDTLHFRPNQQTIDCPLKKEIPFIWDEIDGTENLSHKKLSFITGERKEELFSRNFLGSPSQGSEHSRMFRRHFAEATFPSTLRYKLISEPVFKNLKPV